MAEPEDEDWFLREWMTHLGKRQVALVNELGWDKARANFVFHSKQPYRRDVVNQVARWLGLKPYELLMHPREAQALKALRRSAAVIVAEEDAPPFERSDAKRRRSGTRG